LNTRKIVGWVREQILSNARVVKYGIVGCVGVGVNLGTMALLLTVTSQRGWVPSTVANIASTVINFALHNVWTFSDRQHQGVRLVRGFAFFAVTSLLSIGVTTGAYLGFTRLAAHLATANAHTGIRVALACQFVAILLGASVSYTLNREFTCAVAKEGVAEDVTQVREI
jgi:putative flippase GtrA